MLVNLNDILPQARKKNYAVGAFNTSNLEISQAIVQTAERLRSPVIVATSEKAIRYAGIDYISQIVITSARKVRIPVVLHLDHGSSYAICKECIERGFSSVMIDASHLSFKENVAWTKKVVLYAHRHHVSVEAEIGRLAGIEDDIQVSHKEALYTDPDQAKQFVKRTGCDALAIAIGTSHGAYKFKGKARLKIEILKQITKEVKIPLVLHGASGVKPKWIRYVNAYGGALDHTKGVPDRLLKQAIQHGICKINTDTDLRIAFTGGIREYLSKNKDAFDPRAITGRARAMIEKVVAERIAVFGSMQRA
jgi:fructose-bisphosphate aldolase class II